MQAHAATVAGACCYGCALLEPAYLVEEVDVIGPLFDALEALTNGDGVLAAYRLLRRWRGEVRGEIGRVGRVGRGGEGGEAGEGACSDSSSRW